MPNKMIVDNQEEDSFRIIGSKGYFEDSIRRGKTDFLEWVVVADGHSFDRSGKLFSSFCCDVFDKELRKFNNLCTLEEFNLYIRKVFCECDCLVSSSDTLTLLEGGTTLTVVIIVKHLNEIVTANIGDSEAFYYSGEALDNGKILISKMVSLTKTHSPHSISEQRRIKKQIGRYPYVTGKILGEDVPLFKDGYCVSQDYIDSRLEKFSKKNIRNEISSYLRFPNGSGLAVTRCFGDFKYRQYGLSSSPSVTNCKADNGFVIIATDGFWDLVTPIKLGGQTLEELKAFCIHHSSSCYSDDITVALLHTSVSTP